MSWRIGFALSACLLWPRILAGQVPIGGEFHVNSYTAGAQTVPQVAGDGTGNFIVAWTSDGQDGDRHGIYVQRYDSTGAPAGGEFRVNTYTTGYQALPSVAADAAGNFVVAWTSQGDDGHDWGIFARRYTAAGNPLGLPFRVNTFVTGAQIRPAVAMAPAGNFVVAWDSLDG